MMARCRVWWAAFVWLVLSGVAFGQGGLPQVLHRFAEGVTPVSPAGIASVPEGGALIVTERTEDTPAMIARVLPTGAVSVLRRYPANAYYEQLPRSLVRGGDGRYYGVASSGGPNNKGTIVSIDLHGHSTVAYAFRGAEDGQHPHALFSGPGGSLIGFADSTDHSTYRAFTIDSAGQVTAGAYSLAAVPVSVGPDGSVYGLHNRLRNPVFESGYCEVVRRAPSGAVITVAGPVPDINFHRVLALPNGTVLALATRGSDYSRCDLMRIAPGPPALLPMSFADRV